MNQRDPQFAQSLPEQFAANRKFNQSHNFPVGQSLRELRMTRRWGIALSMRSARNRSEGWESRLVPSAGRMMAGDDANTRIVPELRDDELSVTSEIMLLNATKCIRFRRFALPKLTAGK